MVSGQEHTGGDKGVWECIKSLGRMGECEYGRETEGSAKGSDKGRGQRR